MQVIARDHWRWRVGRRRLPWRSLRPFDYTENLDEERHPVLAAMLLFVPDPVIWVTLLPWWLYFLVSWTFALVLTPATMLLRAVNVLRTPVVAYLLNIDRCDFPGELSADVPRDQADDLVARVRWELQTHGRVYSLHPPV
ncbi:MAG: hypothetical protein ACRD0P_13695 [Stackebrandtia sp.]